MDLTLESQIEELQGVDSDFKKGLLHELEEIKKAREYISTLTEPSQDDLLFLHPSSASLIKLIESQSSISCDIKIRSDPDGGLIFSEQQESGIPNQVFSFKSLKELYEVLETAQAHANKKRSKDYSASEKISLGELIELFNEKQKPTVLIVESDAELAEKYRDRLEREHMRVLNFGTFSELNDYFKGRKSRRFNLVGVLYGVGKRKKEFDDANLDDGLEVRGSLIRQIISYNSLPIVAMRRVGESLSLGLARFGDVEHYGREYQVLYQLWCETVESQLGWLPSSGSDRQYNMGFYERILATNPADIGALFGKARLLKEDGSFDQAYNYYERILKINPDNISAIVERSNLLLDDRMQSKLTEFQYQDLLGMDAIIAYIQFQSKRFANSEIDFLLGKSLVMQAIMINETRPRAKDEPLGDAEEELEKQYVKWKGGRSKRNRVLEDAIVILNKLSEQDGSYQSLIYLAVAHVLKRTKADRRIAYSLLEEAHKKTDPLTELVTVDSDFETEFARDKRYLGTRLAQLPGLHRVSILGDRFAVKTFERRKPEASERLPWESSPGIGKVANEARNFVYFRRKAAQGFLSFSTNLYEQTVSVPEWSLLAHKQGGDFIFEVMPLLPKTIASRFNQISREIEDSERANQLRRFHLDWLIDACASIQLAGTYDGDTLRKGLPANPKSERHFIKLGKKSFIVDHYTSRVFDKLVYTFEALVPEHRRVYLSDKNKEDLISALKPAVRPLMLASDILYLFYTDNNPRNFLVDLPLTESSFEIFAQSKKWRVDLENYDRRLGTGDVLTALEHELTELRLNPPEDKYHIRYYMDRWLSRILAGTPSLTKHKDYEDFFQKISTADALDYGQRAKVIHSANRQFVHQAVPDFSMRKFETIIYHDSLLRHLTIYSDKIREECLVERTMNMFAEKYDFLRGYQPIGSFAKAYETLASASEPDRETNYAVKLAYTRLGMMKEELSAYQGYHRRILSKRLDHLRICKSLKTFLQKHYGIGG